MLTDPRTHPARDRIRAWLGTDLIASLHRRLDAQEATMSEITDALNRLAQQVNGVSAAQASSFHNLQVAIDDLKAGKLDSEQRDIVTRIEAALTKLGEDARVADDGYEPTPHVEDGDVIATPEVPADETPTGEVPAENPEGETGTHQR